MSTPIEHIATLTVGAVESVSPDEIRVLLDTDAPQATALNTGTPRGFPRINSYLLIPNETGAVVGLVVWVGVERSAFPKRKGFQDFGVIDLPFPLRKMSLTPVGTLTPVLENESDQSNYELTRGISVFPSVGDAVVLPTTSQITAIIESRGKDRRVPIGTCPLADNARISIDPDKLFGRHVAVLGNTGSGKSCTVAGLIRWSLSASTELRQKLKKNPHPNARFILLDPNGEYRSAFRDMGDRVRVFQVPPVEGDLKELVIPAWMWNSEEWAAFAQAAPRTQRPMLLEALRDMRAGGRALGSATIRIRTRTVSAIRHMDGLIASGTTGYTGFPQNSNCGNFLDRLRDDLRMYADDVGTDETSLAEILAHAAESIEAICNSRRWESGGRIGYNDFSEADLRSARSYIVNVRDNLPPTTRLQGPCEDAPIPFDVGQLPDHLDEIASDQGGGAAAQFIATLTMRIRMMLSDLRFSPVVKPDSTISFQSWLENCLGEESNDCGQLAIFDLSLVPAEVIHTITAVISRIVFEAVQRYRKHNEVTLPTVLVLEEAHTFVQRGGHDQEDIPTPIQMCRRTFERIAREGRKFGLGLVLSSQRPSELSPTVLAQCNTFLLHRITNDRDQELVSRLVPDNLRGLLKEIPSLPTRQAILLGWASRQPILVEIQELPEDQRPQSADPEFWDVWTGQVKRKVDWKEIVDDWTQQRTEESENSNGEPPDEVPF